MVKKLFFLLVFFFCTQVNAEPKTTICLNMIVKDEAEVIERCLGSLKHLIDYWVIVDTGSHDNTQDIIRKYMKDIPGELHERPWVDFAHNRNEALQLAKNKGDYLLFIDADEVFQMDKGFTFLPLTKDYYDIIIKATDELAFSRVSLIKNTLNWKWIGVLHEIVTCPEAKTSECLKGITNLCRLGGGARSKDPETYAKDAQVLEKVVAENPYDSHNVFYLAQTYFCIDKYDLALKYYERRLQMPGYDEHTFWTLLRIGTCQSHLKMPSETIARSYFKAFQFRPNRAEPLYMAAMLYRENDNPFLGYLIAKYALQIPYPTSDHARVAVSIYTYSLMLEFANCALLSGHTYEGMEACKSLLVNASVPEDLKEGIKRNLSIAKDQLAYQKSMAPPAN